MEADVISRLGALAEIRNLYPCMPRCGCDDMVRSWERKYSQYIECENAIKKMPSAQPEDWMERNKERILQAGMEGREIEFRIGGRLFAIREKAQ